MKVKFRITFEGVTEQEPEWYRVESETEDPSEEETLKRFAAWVRDGPLGWLVESDLIENDTTHVEVELAEVTDG